MFLSRNVSGCKFKQGTRINFAYSDDTEPIRYIVTWKRRSYSRFSLIEVIAYTSTQQVIEPQNEAWPSFLLAVMNEDCAVPYPTNLERFWAKHHIWKDEQQHQPKPLFFKEFSNAHGIQLDDSPASQGFISSIISCFESD